MRLGNPPFTFPLYSSLILLAVLWAFCISTPQQLQAENQEGKDSFAMQTQTQQPLEDIRQLQDKKERQESKLVSLAKEEAAVLNEIETIDSDITDQFKKIEDVTLELEIKTAELQKNADKLNRYREKTLNMQQQLETRLSALWRFGLTGTINTLYQASNMSEFFTKQAYLKQLIKNDQNFRISYRKQIASLEAQKKSLEKEQHQANQTKQALETEAKKLQTKKDKKLSVIAEINRNETKTRSLIAAIEKQEQKLNSLLQDMASKGKNPEQKEMIFWQKDAVQTNTTGFSAKKGRLIAPVKGNFLRPSIGVNDCILISAPLGEDIRAIYDGTVVFSGQLKGYGNTIIIQHEDDFFSLVAQAAKLYRSVGEKVIEGDVVGLVGGGPWLSEGVYVALRHQKTPLDPAKWLKPNSIRD